MCVHLTVNHAHQGNIALRARKVSTTIMVQFCAIILFALKNVSVVYQVKLTVLRVNLDTMTQTMSVEKRVHIIVKAVCQVHLVLAAKMVIIMELGTIARAISNFITAHISVEMCALNVNRLIIAHNV